MSEPNFKPGDLVTVAKAELGRWPQLEEICPTLVEGGPAGADRIYYLKGWGSCYGSILELAEPTDRTELWESVVSPPCSCASLLGGCTCGAGAAEIAAETGRRKDHFGLWVTP